MFSGAAPSEYDDIVSKSFLSLLDDHQPAADS
jgi:hypothetical protein